MDTPLECKTAGGLFSQSKEMAVRSNQLVGIPRVEISWCFFYTPILLMVVVFVGCQTMAFEDIRRALKRTP